MINIPVCEIKGSSFMNLLIFYKILKKLRLIWVKKINQLEEGYNSNPLVCRWPAETVTLQRRQICYQQNQLKKYQTIKEVKQYKHIIKNSSNDYNKNLILNKIQNLNVNNKIYLYKFLNENEMEYYLSHPDRNVRLILTKFRLSEHKLLIEIGRNLKYEETKDYVRFAMSWKMDFIFSLNAREIPIIETFYTNTFKIYIQIFFN